MKRKINGKQCQRINIKNPSFPAGIYLLCFFPLRTFSQKSYPHFLVTTIPLLKNVVIYLNCIFHSINAYCIITLLFEIHCCIPTRCRIYLHPFHPLRCIFENFPVTMKMYFLCSVGSFSLTR